MTLEHASECWRHPPVATCLGSHDTVVKYLDSNTECLSGVYLDEAYSVVDERHGWSAHAVLMLCAALRAVWQVKHCTTMRPSGGRRMQAPGLPV